MASLDMTAEVFPAPGFQFGWPSFRVEQPHSVRFGDLPDPRDRDPCDARRNVPGGRKQQLVILPAVQGQIERRSFLVLSCARSRNGCGLDLGTDVALLAEMFEVG